MQSSWHFSSRIDTSHFPGDYTGNLSCMHSVSANNVSKWTELVTTSRWISVMSCWEKRLLKIIDQIVSYFYERRRLHCVLQDGELTRSLLQKVRVPWFRVLTKETCRKSAKCVLWGTLQYSWSINCHVCVLYQMNSFICYENAQRLSYFPCVTAIFLLKYNIYSYMQLF